MQEITQKKMENNSFIPPDYSEAKEQEFPHDPMIDEDDDVFSDVDVEEEEVDYEPTAAKEDFEVKAVEQQKQENERIAMTTTSSTSPFGSPGNTSPFGAPQQTPWGNQNNSSSVWGSGGGFRPSTPSWGAGSTPSWQTPGTGFGSGVGVGGQRLQIDRAKRVIFCDFIDGAVEAYGANGKPGLRPRDVYDLRPRFEVWDKLAAFNPERLFFVIPASLIPESANGINAWNVTLSYFCCSISSYLRIPFENCQILKQNHIGQNKADVFNAILREGGIKKEDAVVVGIYSGGPGLSNVDQVAAAECGIDYVDLNTLLNSMV